MGKGTRKITKIVTDKRVFIEWFRLSSHSTKIVMVTFYLIGAYQFIFARNFTLGFFFFALATSQAHISILEFENTLNDNILHYQHFFLKDLAKASPKRRKELLKKFKSIFK